MMKLFLSAIGICALCVGGCGDSGSGGGGGAGAGGANGGTDPGGGGGADGGSDPSGGGGASGDLQHSCDSPTTGGHLCTDWAYPVEFADAFSDAQAECEKEGNTFGEACDTTGAVGGCRTTDTGAPGITVTTWVYSGTVADVMAYCTSLTATFVSPP